VSGRKLFAGRTSGIPLPPVHEKCWAGSVLPAVLSNLADIPFMAGINPNRSLKIRKKGTLVSTAGFPALEVLLHRARITYPYDAPLLALKCLTYQNMGSRSISFRLVPSSVYTTI
jgi:hypothetical protein